MLCICDTSVEPYWNLAAEEYLLKEFNEPIFRLWRNDNAIIVGCNQNTLAEIDAEYVNQHNIKVVRRLTGGGAVFHDLGNLNYTFIEPRTAASNNPVEMFRKFTAPIIAALNSLGVNAALVGRNDLLIDGRKFSGNAVCIYKKPDGSERVLQHGTLLFNSNMADISGALKARPEKFIGKSVASNAQRVTNISSHLNNGWSVEDFRNFLMDYIIRNNSIQAQDNLNTTVSNEPVNCEVYEYTARDIEAIDKLCAEKYSQTWWNYGKSPKYSFKNVRKFPFGLIEIYFNVKDGRISNLNIFGDYFSTQPTQAVVDALEGTMHTPGAIEAALNALPHPFEEYFSPAGQDASQHLTAADFARLFY
ncbi:MAG: lipoate--protein ligase [Bacteroidales bacterium]|nr:lipoate--protein ligase [Candidatus Egerieousia equi]